MTGVVGVGTGFGCVTHVRALRAAGFDVLALVGRDPEKTAQRAAAVGVAVACTAFDDALALPGVDAVTIATPPHTHASLALHAIRKGKHSSSWASRCCRRWTRWPKARPTASFSSPMSPR